MNHTYTGLSNYFSNNADSVKYWASFGFSKPGANSITQADSTSLTPAPMPYRSHRRRHRGRRRHKRAKHYKSALPKNHMHVGHCPWYYAGTDGYQGYFVPPVCSRTSLAGFTVGSSVTRQPAANSTMHYPAYSSKNQTLDSLCRSVANLTDGSLSGSSGKVYVHKLVHQHEMFNGSTVQMYISVFKWVARRDLQLVPTSTVFTNIGGSQIDALNEHNYANQLPNLTVPGWTPYNFPALTHTWKLKRLGGRLLQPGEILRLRHTQFRNQLIKLEDTNLNNSLTFKKGDSVLFVMVRGQVAKATNSGATQNYTTISAGNLEGYSTFRFIASVIDPDDSVVYQVTDTLTNPDANSLHTVVPAAPIIGSGTAPTLGSTSGVVETTVG